MVEPEFAEAREEIQPQNRCKFNHKMLKCLRKCDDHALDHKGSGGKRRWQMNLKEVYEIFYPRKSANFSVWEKPQKYRSKQEFFDALIPTELRCLNVKLWNDKLRRSHFLSGNSKESKYLSSVKDAILQNDLMISRIESRGQQILGENICEEAMNEEFFHLIEKEKIECSDRLKTYLVEEESGRLKQEWGNVLTFLTLYAMFPLEVNQLYGLYLTKREKGREGF